MKGGASDYEPCCIVSVSELDAKVHVENRLIAQIFTAELYNIKYTFTP